MRRPRAYILLEVAIGGVLLALLCATLLSSLSDARVRNVVAGRNVVAAQLALEKIEQERSLGFANLGLDIGPSCSAGGTTDTPGGVVGSYTRVCTILPTTTKPFTEHEPGRPAPIVTCKPVQVKVTWIANVGTNPTQSVVETSQVCQ